MNKQLILTLSALCILAVLILSLTLSGSQDRQSAEFKPDGLERGSFEVNKSEKPTDWFVRQRAYPEDTINVAAYWEALEQAKRRRATYPQPDEVIWEEAGPNNIGGRITALGIHPSAPNLVYAGAADGGVLKTVDWGTTWTPVFDEAGALAIGAIAVDPNDSNTVWVGTGEANAAGDNYPGDGIYRSTDGGLSWVHMGLDNSYHVGRIAIDPSNSQRVFVAACGALFSTNPERGVYRTENGGVSWEQVLYLTDSTTAIDVVINPQNPQIVYAAMWERIRHPNQRNVGGVTSGIWRSSDGGNNWTLLSNGLPPQSPDVGRIGLTLCPSNPDVLYAIYADHPGYLLGVWKTTDGGNSWVQTNSPSSSIYSSYGWYFGNIYVDPVDPDKVFALGIYLYRSTNGGWSWSNVNGSMHVDHHAFWIHPDNPNFIWDGNDGGVYFTTTGGGPWTKCYDLHISQFYAIEIDFLHPVRLYGGTQDNGTLRTWTGNLDDWEMILGGDGFYTVIDYTNSNTVFAEYQWGDLRKSTNGGNSFYSCLSGVPSSDRRNWSTPVVMDPVDHNVLYYGTYRLYRTANLAGDWTAISPDLTNGPSGGNLTFNTITTIAVAPTNNQVIYVGADDGNVWVTQNGGGNWTNISGSLPERWVTRVAVSPQDAGIAYVTLSGYKINEYLPHIFRTTDYGENWTDISGNLPEAPVNVVVEDPENSDRLFVGTDLGVYYTENMGTSWELLGIDLPLCTVMDLKLHNPTRVLAAGTHGRSMYKLDLNSLASWPDIDITLTPESPPIQIPITGGSFNYNIAVENLDTLQVAAQIWCDVTLPGGSVVGPLLGPVTAELPIGFSGDRDRTQDVPGNAPSGIYTYSGYVGSYPNLVWNQDSFDFEKLSGPPCPPVNYWSNTGESFDDWLIEGETKTAPEDYFLSQIYPNPFNISTTINFALPQDSQVTLSVYDISGRLITTLINGWRDAGTHEMTFDGSPLVSGIYICRIEAGKFRAVRKMVLVK